jgi:hypothetical protein
VKRFGKKTGSFERLKIPESLTPCGFERFLKIFKGVQVLSQRSSPKRLKNPVFSQTNPPDENRVNRLHRFPYPPRNWLIYWVSRPTRNHINPAKHVIFGPLSISQFKDTLSGLKPF